MGQLGATKDPSKSYPPEPVNVTLFGIQAFVDIIKDLEIIPSPQGPHKRQRGGGGQEAHPPATASDFLFNWTICQVEQCLKMFKCLNKKPNKLNDLSKETSDKRSRHP